MWKSIEKKLRFVEDDLLKNGAYIDSFDALSLASVHVNVGNSEPSHIPLQHQQVSFEPTTRLNGLSKMVTDIQRVLHEAYIEQQGTLISIKSKLDQCRHVVENHAAFARSAASATAAAKSSPSSWLGSGLSSSQGRGPITIVLEDMTTGKGGSGVRHRQQENYASRLTLSGKQSQSNEDDDDDEEGRIGGIGGGGGSGTGDALNQAKADVIRRELKRTVHELYNHLISILDAKLTSYEVVSSSMESYLRIIVKIAQENGVSNSLEKAKHIVQPQCNDLLAHRFLETVEIQAALASVQELYALAFYRNDVTLAARHLTQQQQQQQSPWFLTVMAEDGLLTRFKMGIGLTLVLWSFSEVFNNEVAGQEIWKDPTFAIFICFGDLLLLLWMWGVSIAVWQAAGIDFVRLLALEGSELEGLRLPEATVYASATDLSVMFLVVFIAFNKAARGVFHLHSSLAFAHALPTAMVLFFLYRILSPTSTRKRWLVMLWEVLTAPWHPVNFRAGYIGDLLTSLVRVLIPMCFSFAYLVMSALAWLSNDIKAAASTSSVWWQDAVLYRFVLVPLVTLMPLWIRLMQCLRRSVETGLRWPHMANALKYTSALAVISYGTFRPYLRNSPFWILSFVGATLYQFTWDLTMDWGILCLTTSRDADEGFSLLGITLRKTRLFPFWTYLVVIACNFVMRFAWALTLLPDDGADGPKTFYAILLSYIGPLVAAGEVIRRMVWGFYRLEWEQIETLGSPGWPSWSSLHEMPLEGFDKMEVGAVGAGGGGMGTGGKGAYGHLRSSSSSSATSSSSSSASASASASALREESEWVLTAPVASSVSALILHFSRMEAVAPAKSKARYVESVFFGSAVFAVIMSAAAEELFSLIS